MNFVFYLQSGISEKVLPDKYDGFYIAENIESKGAVDQFYYPGDAVQSELDELCVNLYDVFQDSIFPSRDDFYKNYAIQPQWISRAGLDSDFEISKEQTKEWFSTPIQTRIKEMGIDSDELLEVYEEIEAKKFKYAYVADCQSLINTLQELLCGCHSSFIGFYKNLCSLPSVVPENGVYFQCCASSRMVYSFLYSFIIQSYSIFDILTKIAYELEHLKICESSYEKLSASNVLYKHKKELKIDATGTVFEKCYTTSIIMNLRNELVHNATWEMNPKIFIKTKDGKIIERYILMPDFTEEGTLESFKNRKRFFANGSQINKKLPILYFDILQRVNVTLKKLICKS